MFYLSSSVSSMSCLRNKQPPSPQKWLLYSTLSKKMQYKHNKFQIKTATTSHDPQLNAIENLLWYLIVYIRVKTDMWHGFTKTECKAM